MRSNSDPLGTEEWVLPFTTSAPYYANMYILTSKSAIKFQVVVGSGARYISNWHVVEDQYVFLLLGIIYPQLRAEA